MKKGGDRQTSFDFTGSKLIFLIQVLLLNFPKKKKEGCFTGVGVPRKRYVCIYAYPSSTKMLTGVTKEAIKYLSKKKHLQVRTSD